MKYEKYINIIENMIFNVKENSQSQQSIKEASSLIANSIMSGGILQAYGLGHSKASAIEICGRAGGLIPSKIISSKTEGFVEKVAGVGRAWTQMMDLKEEDIIVIISNSGNTAFGSELAECAKSKGANVILVTSKKSCSKAAVTNEYAKKLFDLSDVILDNYSLEGDAVMEVEGLLVNVAPTSSILNAIVLQSAIYESILIMNEKGFEVPVYKSVNIDGGREFNSKYEDKYASRIFYSY